MSIPRRIAVLLGLGLIACGGESPVENPASLVLPSTPPSVSVGGGLCEGLVQDRLPHPMTPLPKPAVGQAVRDPEFGTMIRRITAVPMVGSTPALRPMYSTISAWNADESRLILYRVGKGHELYDGRTYSYIRDLRLSPPDLEQVYWHTSDPDVLFYADDNRLIRYHVASDVRESIRTFDFCRREANAGGDPMFMSWDSNAIGLRCDGQVFIYRLDTNTVAGPKAVGSEIPAPQVAPSGTLALLRSAVLDSGLNVVRTLDINSGEHASLGRLANGRDTYNGVGFDPGPRGSQAIGSLVVFDMTTGEGRVVVGPSTGYPYPPSGTHVSALAYRRPGWVFVSIVGDPAGRNPLDSELVLADTNTGTVCRIAHHRSWGKNNERIGNSYWAEPHVVASPSGTRALFASDWGGGSSVDAYVVELPGYSPSPR